MYLIRERRDVTEHKERHTRTATVPLAARLRRRSAAARLLRLWVQITPRTWMSVCCDYCVLSGRDLCDVLITRPEE